MYKRFDEVQVILFVRVILMLDQLRNDFMSVFQESTDIHMFFSPGRVNLIGEHTDYNGGHVFPCALGIGTYAVARKRSDRKLRMFSNNFREKGVIECDLDVLENNKDHEWANYPKGVVKHFLQNGYEMDSGFEVLFYGTIPNGAGLSSSASIELATSVMLKKLFGLEITMIEMVKLSQQAENEFVGVNCGIMDQFAIGMGKKEKAMLLNCETLEFTYSPVVLENASLVIANTNKSRGLSGSKYNERRAECERALKQLQQALDVQSLGQISIEEYETYKFLITNEMDQKRAKHVIYENQRTISAVKLLNQGNINGFGQLMNESHISLRDDYEVTGNELDVLVEAAWAEGAIGSRMTGAGFGGCTISIVKNEELDTYIEHVGNIYTKKTGLVADFYVVEIGNGARELSCSLIEGGE